MKIFEATKNTRPILEDSLKYIRSDVPLTVSEREKQWLISNYITTAVDLRTEAEIATKPCPLSEDGRFSYMKVTLTGGDRIPASVDDVTPSYIAMADERFDGLIDFLLKLDTGALYFCSAGKDRTGVVSAALLYRLGASVEYIVGDYMASRENLSEGLIRYAEKNPSVDIEVITPREEYIRDFLLRYAERLKSG